MLNLDGIIFSLQRSGGISVYFREIAKRCFRANLPARLRIYGNENPIFLEEPWEEEKLYRSPISIPSVARFLSAKVDKKASVFHSSYYRITKSVGVRSVTTVHDFTHENGALTGARSRALIYLKRKAISKSDAIISISQATTNELLERFPNIQGRHVVTIYNGVSDEFNRPARAFSARPIYVVFVGSRAHYKGFELAVKAVSLLASVDCWLYVIGGGALSSSERSLLNKNIGGRFRAMPHIDTPSLADLLSQAVALVYPSEYEGFGLPPIEAMRASCPPIVRNTSCLPEVCGDAAVLLETQSPDECAEKILMLLDEGVRRRFQLVGESWASQYSWDRCFEATKSVYQELGLR
jgi:mannosyltransferase